MVDTKKKDGQTETPDTVNNPPADTNTTTTPAPTPAPEKTTTKAKTTSTKPPSGPKKEGSFNVTEETFATALKDFKIANEAKIAEYVAASGNFDDPINVDRALSEMSVDINRRKPFIRYWFGMRKVTIPEEVQKKLESQSAKMSKDDIEEEEAGEKVYAIDPSDNSIVIADKGQRGITYAAALRLKNQRAKTNEQGSATRPPAEYVYDHVAKVVRFATGTERGGSKDEAINVRDMALNSGNNDDISPFLLDENGNWQVNQDPKVKHTRADMITAMMLMQAQAKGLPFDPIDSMVKLATIFPKETPNSPQPLPSWITDPVAFSAAVKSATPPPVTQDPQMLQDLKDMRAKLEKMEEDAHKKEMEELNTKLDGINTAHKKETEELKQLITAGQNKSQSGKTEIDVLGDGLAGIQREGAGWRDALIQFAKGGYLPKLPSGPQGREQRREIIREAIKKDEELERLTKELFQGQAT